MDDCTATCGQSAQRSQVARARSLASETYPHSTARTSMPVIACTGSFLSAAWTLVSSSADDFGLLTCLTRGVPLDPAR